MIFNRKEALLIPAHHVDDSQTFNFERVKDKIYVRLFNYKRNKNDLKTVLYSRFLDLAVVPIIILEMKDSGYAYTFIHRTQLEKWNISKEEIFQTAHRNGQGGWKMHPIESSAEELGF